MQSTRATYASERVVVTDSTTSVLTVAKYGGQRPASAALLTFEGTGRFTMDGVVTPSATVGHKIADGSSIFLENLDDISDFKAWGTASLIIQASYQR